jgi:CheY-like chemotaxis protein
MQKTDSDSPAGKTLLIVDDEFGVLEVLEFILKDAGFSVASALNGQDALTRLKEVKPDLLILDLMMPILDGIGVIEAIRSNDGLKSIPIILVSALSEHAVRLRCTEYNAFLRKPYKIEDLMQAISKLLSNGEN